MHRCRLDGGVESEQVGLAGDVLNEFHYVADLLRRLRQRRNFIIGRLRLAHRHAHHLVGLIDLAADLCDRAYQLASRHHRGLDVGRGVTRCRNRALSVLPGLVGGRRQGDGTTSSPARCRRPFSTMHRSACGTIGSPHQPPRGHFPAPPCRCVPFPDRKAGSNRASTGVRCDLDWQAKLAAEHLCALDIVAQRR